MSKHKNCKNCLLLTTALLNVSTTAAMEGKSPIIKQNEFIEPKVIDNVNPGLKVIESRTLRPRRPAMAKKGRALDKVLNNKSVTKSVGLTDATEPQIRVQSPRAKIPQKSEQRRLRKRGSTSPKGVADGTIEDAVIKRGFIAPTASARSTQTKEEQQAVKKEGISGMKRLDDAERSRKKVSLERIKAGRGRRGGRGRGRGGDRGTVKGETSAKKEAEEKAERNRLKKKISRSKDADLVRGKDKDAKMEDKTTVDLTVRSLKSGSKKPIKEPSTPIQELSGNDRLRRRRSASPKGRKKRKSPTRVAIDETKAAQSSTGSVKSTQTKEQAVKKEGASSKSAPAPTPKSKFEFDATGSVESGSVESGSLEPSIADKAGDQVTASIAAKVEAKNKEENEETVDLSAEEKAEKNAKEAIEDESGMERLEEKSQKSEDTATRDLEVGLTAQATSDSVIDDEAKKEPKVEEPAKEASKEESKPEEPKQEEEKPVEEPKVEETRSIFDETVEEEVVDGEAATDATEQAKKEETEDESTRLEQDEAAEKAKMKAEEAAKAEEKRMEEEKVAEGEAEEQDEAADDDDDSETRELVVEDESQHDVSANDDDDDDARGESDSTSIQQLAGKSTISDQTVDEAPKEETQTLADLATGDLDEDESKNDDSSEIEDSTIQQLSGRESSSSDETVDEVSKAEEVEQQEPSQTTIIIMIIAVLVLLFAMFCSST